jgi:hypothetical protein
MKRARAHPAGASRGAARIRDLGTERGVGNKFATTSRRKQLMRKFVWFTGLVVILFCAGSAMAQDVPYSEIALSTAVRNYGDVFELGCRSQLLVGDFGQKGMKVAASEGPLERHC